MRKYMQLCTFIKYFVLFITLVTSIIFIVGCSTKNNKLSIPTSAKKSTNNQIIIPFPYSNSPNGDELWKLDRDTSNHFVLKFLYKGKEEARFPINGIGVTQANGKISLDGNNYSVISINLNDDQTSGWATLK